jgi:hypothetical protein
MNKGGVEVFREMIQEMINKIGEFGNVVGDLFLSPFDGVVNAISDSQVLGMLNWVLPIAEMVALLQLWVMAIAAWYAVKPILRWIKTIS